MRLLGLFCAAGLLAQAQSSPVYSDPGSLAAELHRLENGPQIISSLPASWVVEASGRRYSISTAPLRKMPSAEAQRTWLDQLARELESFPTVPDSTASARTQLDRILARREFAPVRPPTLWERLSQRIIDWIAGIIRSIVAYAKQHPTSGTILFWLAAAAAVGFLGFWLFRLWGGKRRTPLPQPEQVTLGWTWQQWALAAREARDRGDMRTAIHCAYWAAVVRLQDIQLLPRDSTRTPREYLGLVPDHEISRAPLAALTSALERFWYAARPASPADLHESLANMEALGCRLD
jgi:Domain of unknown function (DUF4129)